MPKTAVATDKYLDMYAKVKSEKGRIESGERVYFSIYLIDEMESNWHKLLNYIQTHKFKTHYEEEIDTADVVVIDAVIFLKLSEAYNGAADKKSFDPNTYKYWEEYTKALKLGKRVVDFSDWNKEYHRDLTKLDERSYSNINQMLQSTDEQTLELAVSLMSSTNREDPTTIKYLKELTKNVNESKLKSHVDFRELVAFLAKAYEE